MVLEILYIKLTKVSNTFEIFYLWVIQVYFRDIVDFWEYEKTQSKKYFELWYDLMRVRLFKWQTFHESKQRNIPLKTPGKILCKKNHLAKISRRKKPTTKHPSGKYPTREKEIPHLKKI